MPSWKYSRCQWMRKTVWSQRTKVREDLLTRKQSIHSRYKQGIAWVGWIHGSEGVIVQKYYWKVKKTFLLEQGKLWANIQFRSFPTRSWWSICASSFFDVEVPRGWNRVYEVIKTGSRPVYAFDDFLFQKNTFQKNRHAQTTVRSRHGSIKSQL